MNKINYNVSKGEILNPFIKIKPGQCPYCGSNVIVLESEITSTVLNEDGSPILCNTEYLRTYAYCEACNTKIPVIKNGYNFETCLYKQLKNTIDSIFGNKVEEEPIKENPFGRKGEA